MAENKQDKRDIVNPNPERYTSAVPQARRGRRPFRRETLMGYQEGFIRDAVLEWRGVPENWGRTAEGERRGLNYDYNDVRNKWFIGWLHRTFKKGKDFPNVGFNIKRELYTESNNLHTGPALTIADILAYAALYPQNAKVIKTSSGTPHSKENPRIGGYIIALVPMSKIEKAQTLKKVAEDVKRESPEDKTALETVTTDESQKPANQTPESNDRGSMSTPLPVSNYVVKKGDWLSRIAKRHNTTVTKILEVPQNAYVIGAPRDQQGRKRAENGHWIYPGDIITLPGSVAASRMPSVTPTISEQRKKEYDSVSPPTSGSAGSPGSAIILPESLPPVKTSSRGIDSNTPWNNCPPIKPATIGSNTLKTTNNNPSQLKSDLEKLPRKVYYNPQDKSWYCVATTLAKNPESFDIANQPTRNDVITGGNAYRWMEIATKEILKTANKFTEANESKVKSDHANDNSSTEIIFSSHYGHPARPQPVPAGSDVWLISAKIDNKVIEELPEDGATGKEDDEPSSLVVAKAVMDLEVPARRAPFTISKLKTNLRNIAKMLETTYKELASDGITPMMMEGVNLLEEAEEINTFYTSIEEWAKNRNISISDDDRIEFVLTEDFNLQLIYYNGALQKVPHEKNDDESIVIVPDPEFDSVFQSTFALVFFGEKITQIRRTRKSERPPATEFVTRFIYPSPIIRPTEIAAKKEKNLEENKYPSEPTGTALGSNDFSRPAPPEDKKPSFKTNEEVQSEFDKKFARGKQFLGGYIGVLNNAGCESPLAKYLNDAFLLFQLMGGKCSFKELVATVLRLIKEDIMITKQQEQLLLLGAGYAENPDRLLKEIEAQINQEIMCLFGLLGDILENEVLDPGGVPPEVTKLVKAGLTPPRGINFTSITIPDLVKIWREMIKVLVLEFVKQLILAAFKELLLASAGCGGQTIVDPSKPPQKRSGAGAQNLAPSRYSAININELVDYKGIDLEELAAELNIYNTLFREDNLRRSPAAEAQLRQLNDDASEVLVDLDLTALFQGTAPSDTINLLYRTFNMGPIAVNSINTALRRQIENNEIKVEFAKAIVGEFQESARAGDTRYGSLNLDRKNIRKYFKRLGQLLGAEIVLGLEGQLDPELDLCERGDILGYGLGAAIDISSLGEGEDDNAIVAGGLSKNQILRQIRDQIDSDTRRITSLCDLNASDFDFIQDVQNFWDLIPFPAFFFNLLDMIRKLMQNILKMQAEGAMKYNIRIKSPVENAEDELDAESDVSFVLPQDTEIGKYFYRFWGGGDSGEPGLQLASTLKFRVRQDKTADSPRRRERENAIKSPRWIVGSQNTNYNVSRGEVELVYIPGDPSLSGSPAGTCKVVFNRTTHWVGDHPEDSIRAGAALYEPEQVLAEFLLAEENLPNTRGKYSIKQHLSGVDPSHFADGQFSTILNSYIKTLHYVGYSARRGEQQMPIGGNGGALLGAKAIAQTYNLGQGRTNPSQAFLDVHALAYPTVNNYYNIPDTVVKVSYGTQNKEFARRVTDTLVRASVPVFGPNEDPCNVPTEEFTARVVLNMFQVRLMSFITNGLPFFNNGYSLMTTDTINMLGSYLSNKIMKDLYKKDSEGLISIQKVWEGVELISRTCTLFDTEPDEAGNPKPLEEDLDDGKVAFRFDNLSEQDTGTDLPGMFHYIIRQMLKRMLLNVSAGTAITDSLEGDELKFQGYVTTKRNYFKMVEDNTGEELGGALSGAGDRYRLLAKYLKRGRLKKLTENRRPFDPQQSDAITVGGWLGLGSDNKYRQGQGGLNTREDIRTMDNEEFADEKYLAYMPIPLLVGLQYIYIDKVINISQNVPALGFQQRAKIRMADVQAMMALDSTYLPPPISSEYTDFDVSKELKRTDHIAARGTNVLSEQEDRIMSPWKQNEFWMRQQAGYLRQQEAMARQQDVAEAQRIARGAEQQQQDAQPEQGQQQDAQPEQREQQQQQQEQQEQQREDQQQEEQQGGRQQPPAPPPPAPPVSPPPQEEPRQPVLPPRRSNPPPIPPATPAPEYEQQVPAPAGSPYPVTIGGRVYRNLDELQARHRYLIQVRDQTLVLKNLKLNLQRRLEQMGSYLSQAEEAKGGAPYDKFRLSNREAMRGKIQQTIRIINQNTSLNISNYGGAGGNNEYDPGTDLKVRGADSITSADFRVGEAYHQGTLINRTQAVEGNRKLWAFVSILEQGFMAQSGGMRDTGDLIYYQNLIAAVEKFWGTFERTPPTRRLSSNSEYSLRSRQRVAESDSNIIGILANISLKTKQLDRLNIMTEEYGTWGVAKREQIEILIEQLRLAIEGRT